MLAKLTEASVAKLDYAKPGAAPQYKVSDTQQRGFMVRIGRDSKTFIVQASVDGKPRTATLGRLEDGMKVETARLRAVSLIASWRTGQRNAAAGHDPVPVSATLTEALEMYLALSGSKGGRKIKRKESTIKSYRETLQRHTPAEWWEQPIAALTYKMVDDQHNKIGEAGHATADMWARYLRAVYESYDRRHPEMDLPKNPVKAVDHFKPAPRRDVLTWADLPAWWRTVESLSPIRCDCWKFLLLSGLRSNAGSQIRWSEIDLENGTLTVPAERMKAGHDFTVPLSRYVVKMLAERKANNAADFGGHDGGYVFPTMSMTGQVQPIYNLNQQGYRKGTKIRLLSGPQTLRRTFNTIATDDVRIPDAHRLMLVDHSMPYSGVNGRHYYGKMGDDPVRESLERITVRILTGAGQQYEPSPDAQPAMKIA